MRLVPHASVLVMPFCCGAVRMETGNGELTRIISFGQNVWGNLAVSSSDCSVTTAAGVPEPACSPQIVNATFHAPAVALGATWTHVVADGHLYSAGWAGDGGCGFSPNVQTMGMQGEHVTELVDASTRWLEVSEGSSDPDISSTGSLKVSEGSSDLDIYANAFKSEIQACKGKEFQLASASAAYTSSLFLSADGRCVFTTGLTGDLPTQKFAIPGKYVLRGTLKRPLPVFASEEKKVLQVLATYGNNFVLMEDGTVLSAAGFNGVLSDEKVASSWSWERAFELTKPISQLYGNGWTYYAALAKDGDFYMWSDWSSIPGMSGDDSNSPKLVDKGVSQAALGPEHFFVLKADGSLWSAGSNGCGQTGRQGTSTGLAQVEGSWKAACAGFYYSMAIGADDQLYMWGSINANTYRGGEKSCTQEGKTHSSTPLPIVEFFAMQGQNSTAMPPHIDSIACGFYHGMAMAKVEQEA
eukprot:TRINITY_DN5901_c0_g2_i1.p1 TRINITY_DN5901_c0_g2~~TRINITY_DN5901_c0_g2_i1.p1  ORF type:complete len:469 (-),score=74.75 TRINITY_DN5901_c0_g2_i1:82-1488(-)